MTVPEVASIHLESKAAILEDGQILQIVEAFDDDGDDCDLDDAVVCVAGPDKDGMFLTIDFRDWESVTIQ